jgi:hypothetical protein
MNSGIRMLAGIAVGVGLLIVPPDGARAQEEPQGAQGAQGGCREAGQFIATSARELGRGFGEFSSELAALGLRDDFAQGLHSTLCEPQA